MKTENQTKEARLGFFRDLYENAKTRYGEQLEEFDKNARQYHGDPSIDGSAEPANTVRNITYEIVESQVSSDIPLPKVDAACFSERRDRNARSVEQLCIAVRDALPFESMNDLDERYTYIYGGSVWFVEWEESPARGKETGGIRIHCLSPKDLIPEPNLSDIADMEYCFLRFTTTRAELQRRFGVSADESFLAEAENVPEGILPDEDSVTLVVCFFRDEEGEIGRYVFSGDLVLSDLPRFYHRKTKAADGSGRFLDTECEILTHDIATSDGAILPAFSPKYSGGEPNGEEMAPTCLPYFVPKSFPIVIRRNTSAEGKLFGLSDCAVIRPQQQAINKIESRILQKLLRAGVTPILPEDASVAVNNAVFGQVIRLKPGESAAQYGKVDTTPDIAQDIAEAERLYDQAKRTVGISDAFQGNDTSYNESGYARQLRISQASGRLESKKKMKYTAYAEIDRLIFEHYLAFADEPRTLSYKDSLGRMQDSAFNRYDFLTYRPEDGTYRFDDDYLFSVDLNGGAEFQREALWERNLANLKAGTLGDPEEAVTLLRYWQSQERAHYPFARENVEYFRAAIAEKADGRSAEQEVPNDGG